MSQNEFEVGAYFYPHTTYSPDRFYRALEVGRTLNIKELLQSPNELELIRDAPPLFPGHDQPRIYCLDAKTTTWDDCHTADLIGQIALARSAGLTFFIFDSYCGLKEGEPQDELTAPLDYLLQMAELTPNIPGILSATRTLPAFKYACMETLESPRVVLPMPTVERGKMFAEPDRQYDITPESARYIIDKNARHWRHKHYLRVKVDCGPYSWPNGRPYLSILMPNFGDAPEHTRWNLMKDFMEALRQHALKEYNEYPYVVGVIRGPGDAERWLDLAADAITHYAFLPDFNAGAPPIQDYSQLMQSRQESWTELHKLANKYDTSYIPALSVGWDASPRGARGYTWEEVAGKFPYSPIVVGNTPERIGAMLKKAIAFTLAHVPEEQRLIPMFAWNEMGEGGVLLPRLLPDGSVDNSRLEAVRHSIAAARTAGGLALHHR